MSHYYNEHDPFAAAWLRSLIAAGEIPAGDVDGRDIREVKPDDVNGYTQAHFFAGIGGWPLALRLAGWPEDRRIWTGSCPCQPWSDSNVWERGGKGHGDERHLWPVWFDLIEECRPPALTGEQVTGAIAKGWLDGVYIDLERAGYAVGSAVLPAYAVEAEHQRNRLYWVAYTGGARRSGHQQNYRISITAESAFTINGDPLVRARRALAGDYSSLLPCDGLSLQLERDALTCYGNAIVPQIAAEFVAAFMDAERGAQ